MKVSPSQPKSSVIFNTSEKKINAQTFQWWLAKNKEDLCGQVVGTAAYLKESQAYRYRQTAIYARLYGNMSLYNFIGSNTSKMDSMQSLPQDRPTFNLVSSAVDTLVSRLSQARPAPVFLTDNGDYKKRKLSKQLNNFILGEFHQTKAYEKAAEVLRDALITGTGCLKIYQTPEDKVGLDRVLLTELLTDPNEGIYGEPRQLFQLKLMDRSVLMDRSPQYKEIIRAAATAYPDNSSDAAKTVSDLVMVVEAWHLPSGPDAKDGRHTIACSSGVLLDEKWTKPNFPFVFLHYSKRLLGFWSQGIAERLMGTQLEINSLLYTISRAIKLVGVPRVFIEAGSKITKASNNNDIGVICEYRGTKPIYEVAPCNAPELYEQLQRLIDYGYRQEGVSALDASAEKPAGLNSGEAIRTYDDISTDRFASTARTFDNLFIDLAYAITDLAADIAIETGKYQSLYPNKNGTKQIDFPEIDKENDPFVIQCFNMSSLPRDPAGRMQKVAEMIQAGMITVKEGRRLLDYPDLDQIEKLANASEERIFQILDEIVEDGEYTPPDPFMDLQLANDTVVQYYNLYSSAKLEEERCQMLRDFFTQIQALKQAAMPPAPPPMAGMGAPGGGAPPPSPTTNAPPQATAMPLPQSPLVPNAVS